MQTFGKRLAAARNAQGLTQEELARALGVARNTISSWERDRTLPDVETLRRLSMVLKCDLMAPDVSDSSQDTPAGEAASADTIAAAQPAGPDAPAPFSRQKKLAWTAAAIAVLCACLVAYWLHARSPEPEPTPGPEAFSADYYRQETPNVPGQAYFTFDNRAWQAQGDSTTFQHYMVRMDEQNGVGFTISRVELRLEGHQGNVHPYNLSASDLQASGAAADIPAYGSFSLDGGFPAGEFVRIGVTVFGNDANDTPLVFYSLIEL